MLKPHESVAFGLDSRGPQREREVKLGAGPAFHLPDLAGVVEGVAVAPPETVRLETIYYDTPDLRLARWGVSLRHRAGEGWTLKLSPAKRWCSWNMAPFCVWRSSLALISDAWPKPWALTRAMQA